MFAGPALGGCVSGFTRSVVHGILLLALLVSAVRYLRHPDDAYRPLADALLAHPAAQEGQPLLYYGPLTQAPNFYSLYDVKFQKQLPAKGGPRAARGPALFRWAAGALRPGQALNFAARWLYCAGLGAGFFGSPASELGCL